MKLASDLSHLLVPVIVITVYCFMILTSGVKHTEAGVKASSSCQQVRINFKFSCLIKIPPYSYSFGFSECRIICLKYKLECNVFIYFSSYLY